MPRPRERVHHPTNRSTEYTQLLNDIILAIAAMNDDGKVALECEVEMPVEPRLLLKKRSAMPVAVEPCFADGDRPPSADHFHDPRPIVLADFGRVVGVNAYGGENSAVCACKVEC